MDWEKGSVGKLLAVLTSITRTNVKPPGVVVQACNPRAGEAETLASQSGQFGELQANEKCCL